jgi:transcription elongation factor Elf1
LLLASWVPDDLETGDTVFQGVSRNMKKPKKTRRRRRPAADLEAMYICDSCGEEIVVPVDISAGAHQDYVEDCPVCCHPMTLHVDIDPDGEAHVEGEHE